MRYCIKERMYFEKEHFHQEMLMKRLASAIKPQISIQLSGIGADFQVDLSSPIFRSMY